MYSVQRGSQTAKDGFRNENEVSDKFNDWIDDEDSQQWLEVLGYNLQDIVNIKAEVLHGYKTDVTVEIQTRFGKSVENIQVKLVSNKKGFNQVDKRRLSHYQDLWEIPDEIFVLLQYFTGEKKPCREGTRDRRRMFLTEFTLEEQQKILDWFEDNESQILSDIIKGRGEYMAQWVMVAQKINTNARWVIVPSDLALQHYAEGGVRRSPRGSIYIGQVTVQRKGGDSGRETANMLQFKLDPTELFDL